MPDWPGQRRVHRRAAPRLRLPQRGPLSRQGRARRRRREHGDGDRDAACRRGAARVRVSFRTPVNIMPPTFLGVPATVLARMSENAPAWIVDRVGFLMQRLAWGDLSPYGMPRSPYGIATELRVQGPRSHARPRLRCRAQGRAGWSWCRRWSGSTAPTWCSPDGERIQPQVVIAATGYGHGLEPLVGHLGVLLPSGKPAASQRARSSRRARACTSTASGCRCRASFPRCDAALRRIARAIARERPPGGGLSHSAPGDAARR